MLVTKNSDGLQIKATRDLKYALEQIPKEIDHYKKTMDEDTLVQVSITLDGSVSFSGTPSEMFKAHPKKLKDPLGVMRKRRVKYELNSVNVTVNTSLTLEFSRRMKNINSGQEMAELIEGEVERLKDIRGLKVKNGTHKP